MYLLAQEFLKLSGGKGTLAGVGAEAAESLYQVSAAVLPVSWPNTNLLILIRVGKLECDPSDLRADVTVRISLDLYLHYASWLDADEDGITKFRAVAEDDIVLSVVLSRWLATPQAGWIKEQTTSFICKPSRVDCVSPY